MTSHQRDDRDDGIARRPWLAWAWAAGVGGFTSAYLLLSLMEQAAVTP